MRDVAARLRSIQGIVFDLDGTLLALRAPGTEVARWMARLPGVTRP